MASFEVFFWGVAITVDVEKKYKNKSEGNDRILISLSIFSEHGAHRISSKIHPKDGFQGWWWGIAMALGWGRCILQPTQIIHPLDHTDRRVRGDGIAVENTQCGAI